MSGWVWHVGVALLVELADRIGLTTAARSQALAGRGSVASVHDLGRELLDVEVMLADDGVCVTDMDAYHGQ